MDLNLVLAVTFGCLFMAGMVWLTVRLIKRATSIYEPMDEPLAALGFAVTSTGGLGRRYAGAWQGRDVTLTFRPRHKVASKFDLSMRSSHKLGLSLGAGRPLLTPGRWKRLEGPFHGLAAYKVYGSDPAQAAALLRGHGAALALDLLAKDHEEHVQPRELYVRPGEVLLRRVPRGSGGWYHLGVIEPDELRGWLDAMHGLATLAEGL